MIAALLLALLAQRPPVMGSCGPEGPVFCSTAQSPLFEFAPASGAGMGTACACTTPTGAKGEVMTLTRASSGTCLKGATGTGIANGDLVTCSTNQPRVMPGGDGTGGLGLLVEGSRTNDLLRSQELENAVWVSGTFGVAAITVTANAATAPDGTLTADRLQIPAAGAGQYSLVSQSPLTGATRVGSVFAKGNGESGTLYVMQAGGTVTCSLCAYNPTTWTQCVTSGVSTNQSTFNIGSDPLDCGGGAQGARDVFVWGAQSEIGAFATSYIATAAAAVTRSAETATFPVSLANATGSMAATMTTTTAFTDINDHAWIAESIAGPNYAQVLDFRASVTTFTAYGGAAGGVAIVGALLVGNNRALAFWTSAASVTAGFNGSFVSGSWTAPIPATTLVEIGTYSAVSSAFAVIKQICVDPSPARCR